MSNINKIMFMFLMAVIAAGMVGCMSDVANTVDGSNAKVNLQSMTTHKPPPGTVDIYVDKETGVEYIYLEKYYDSKGSTALSPRLDATGKPIIKGNQL